MGVELEDEQKKPKPPRKKVKRQRGRQPKGLGPALPEEEVDRILVHGEVVPDEENGGTRVSYPGHRELAARYGVSPSLISWYSRKHNCMARREQAALRAREMADTKLAEFRADRLAVSRDDQLRIIDKYLARFEEALQQGRVDCTNPSDFNNLSRLKELLTGGPDARNELVPGLRLEDLQRRHKETVEAQRAAPARLRGEVLALPERGEDGDDCVDAVMAEASPAGDLVPVPAVPPVEGA